LKRPAYPDAPKFFVVLLTGFALALALLGMASASTPAPAKYGGVLVVAQNGEPTSLDPTLDVSTLAAEIYEAMCLPLYIRGSRLQRIPVLAAGPPVLSSDKLSYTVPLRKGVRFNDGTPFDAEAVVTTVQRYMTYPGSKLASDYNLVDSVTRSGPYTVVFHLKQRDSALFGDRDYILSPSALQTEGAGFSANPVCVGPFMFDHWVRGDSITLIKSKYYYDAEDVFLDKLVFKPIPDAGAAMAALEAGDVQAIDNVSTTDVDSFRQDPSVRVLQSPQFGWGGVIVNIGNRNGAGNLPYENIGTPLAQSAKLRQAFEEAIDRQTLNKVVFSGLYQPSCTVVSPADRFWFNRIAAPCTPYDPADARRLVAASGIQSPTVHLLVRNSSDRPRLAQFIQAEEAAVGINVVIDLTDNGTETARRTSGNFDADVATSGAVPGDPNANFYTRFTSDGGNNQSGYSNPRLDYVLAEAVKATDPKARGVYYRVAQQIIHDERSVIVLYSPVTFAAYSANVTGVELTNSGALVVPYAHFR
jgi:peptide/nickel transport system substrate-binding protein